MVGGFLSGSQALKADALDFLGDGLITFLGILAIGWSLVWRARSALIQGVFLGALGLGVLASTAYRVLVVNQPEAELMGLFGIIALAVNVAAARSEEHTSELQSLMRISYAVFCLKKKIHTEHRQTTHD